MQRRKRGISPRIGLCACLCAAHTFHGHLSIDDDVKLVAMLREYFEQDNFAMAAARNRTDCTVLAWPGQYLLGVLDVMMARSSSFGVSKRTGAGNCASTDLAVRILLPLVAD